MLIVATNPLNSQTQTQDCAIGDRQIESAIARKLTPKARESGKASGPCQLPLPIAIEPAPPPKPALSARLAPASWHSSKCNRYWLVLSHPERQYGPLFYKAEIDCILEHFSGRTGPIDRDELDPIAAEAITAFTGRMGAAA